MPPVEFEITIPVSERPQTYALDHAATGTEDRCISRSKCIGTGSTYIGKSDAGKQYDSLSVIKHPCTYQVLLQLVQLSDESGSAT